MAKICWCTPFGMLLDVPESVRTKDALQNSATQHTFMKAEIDMNVVSLARNSIVQSVINTDVDYLWWVDSDVLVPANGLELLDYIDDEHPIVSGLYFSRRFPYHPQAYTRAAVHTHGEHPFIPIVDLPDKPSFVDAVGAGFMLVQRTFLVQMQARYDEYFKVIRDYLEAGGPGIPSDVRYGLHLAQSVSPWFEFLNKVGEDFYFCDMAHRMGVRPFLIPHVQAYHVGPQNIGYEHFDALRKAGITYLG